MNQEKLAMGRIVNTRGLKGELIVLSYTEPPEQLLDYQKLFMKDGFTYKEIKILKKSTYKGQRLALKMEGINDIDLAENLKDKEIFVNADELETIQEDEFFYYQIEGTDVFIGKKFIGKVVTVQNFGSCDLLEVDAEDKKHNIYLPVLNDFIEVFDVENKKVVYQDVDGLI